ncbi:MAG: hypothetical protein II655_05330, partial [Thermoguttaceae bacterium]|nr:hypothetical protein [Thermoguttaceae bacterium]
MQRNFLIFIGLLVATVFLCRAFLAKKPPVPAELRAPTAQDVVSAEPGPDADGAWIDYRALFVKRSVKFKQIGSGFILNRIVIKDDRCGFSSGFS